MSKKDFSRLRKNRLLHFQLGMICSLCFVLFAFNYSTEGSSAIQEETIVELPIELTNLIPRTKDFNKPLPPPIKAPTEKIEVVDELPTESPEQTIPAPIEIPIDKAVKFVAPIVKKPVVITVPEPVEEEPVEKVEEPDFFINVQEMPSFPGCEGESIHQCQSMLKYIYKNINYPSIARENGIEGTVVVQFIIDKDGSLVEVKTVKDVGGGCSKEALRVVNGMPRWKPGKQQNKAVRVQFNLPIRFKLK